MSEQGFIFLIVGLVFGYFLSMWWSRHSEDREEWLNNKIRFEARKFLHEYLELNAFCKVGDNLIQTTNKLKNAKKSE